MRRSRAKPPRPPAAPSAAPTTGSSVRPVDRPPIVLFALFALGTLGLYAALAPAVSGFGDHSELALVLATGGVPHPTGYPLYVLFGQPFVHALHAIGLEWPRAAAAWSHLGAAVAVFFLLMLAWRLGGRVAPFRPRERAVAAGLAAGSFACNPIWLEQATLAEVYSWHLAWASGAAWLFLGLSEAMGRRRKGGERDVLSHAPLWGLAAGLGLAHHRTSLLLLAPLTLVLLWQSARTEGARRTALRAAIGVGAALLPLASYLLVAWRAFHPAGVQWPALVASWSSVWDHVTGRIYWDYAGSFAPATEVRALLAAWGTPFLVPGLAVLVVLLLSAKAKPSRPALAGLAGGVGLGASIPLLYGVPDAQAFFLMPLAIAAAALAPAWAALFTLRSLSVPLRVVAGAASLLAVGAVAIAGIRAWNGPRDAIEHNDRLVRRFWESLPADTAIVFWPADAYLRLREYQVFGEEKRAIYVMNPGLIGYPRERREFRERFGFDPLHDFPPAGGDRGGPEAERRRLLLLARHVNARTRAPVIYFSPQDGIVRRLPKPGAEATPAP